MRVALQVNHTTHNQSHSCRLRLFLLSENGHAVFKQLRDFIHKAYWELDKIIILSSKVSLVLHVMSRVKLCFESYTTAAAIKIYSSFQQRLFYA